MTSVTNQKLWKEFIAIYRERSELWNSKSSQYKNTDLKREGYALLLRKMLEIDETASLEQVKKKINTLRTNYRRELKKVKKSIKLEGGTGYTPSLWYFRDLDFLRRKRTANGGISMDSDDDFLPEFSKNNQQNHEEMAFMACPWNHTNCMDMNPDYTDNNGMTSQNGSCERRCKIFPKTEMDMLLSKDGAMESINDDADIYGRSWAFEYRKLAPDQQLYAKKHIDDILFQGRLGRLS